MNSKSIFIGIVGLAIVVHAFDYFRLFDQFQSLTRANQSLLVEACLLDLDKRGLLFKEYLSCTEY